MGHLQFHMKTAVGLCKRMLMSLWYCLILGGFHKLHFLKTPIITSYEMSGWRPLQKPSTPPFPFGPIVMWQVNGSKKPLGSMNHLYPI